MLGTLLKNSIILSIEEGLEFLKKVVTYYAEEVDFLSSYNLNVKNVDSNKLEKLKALAYALRVNYKFKEDMIIFLDDDDNNSELEEKGFIIESWISLGAILRR